MSILTLLLLGVNVYFLVVSWKQKSWFWVALNAAIIAYVVSGLLTGR